MGVVEYLGSGSRSCDGERGCLCDAETPVMRGIIAIRREVASLVVFSWVREVCRPRGLDAWSRPSRTPSKSTVLGGSFFVASYAAYLRVRTQDAQNIIATYHSRSPNF